MCHFNNGFLSFSKHIQIKGPRPILLYKTYKIRLSFKELGGYYALLEEAFDRIYIKVYNIHRLVTRGEMSSMELTQENVKDILTLAMQNTWHQRIPQVRARHRLAINSLIAQDSLLFDKSPKEIVKTLMQDRNKGIRKILRDTDEITIAFAIRDAFR